MVAENILPANADTLLTISTLGELQYMARGLTQTLDVIKEAVQQRRTINGSLIDISNPQFRKYASKLTCSDIGTPPLDNLWPGYIVTVGCAVSLSYPTGNPGSPFKPVVSGSEYVQGHYTFYRPMLTMMVGIFDWSFDEWGAKVNWSLDLEEV